MKKLLAIALCLALCMGVLAITASAEGTTYYVTGDDEICGSDWDPADSNNVMKENADGTYSLTLKDAPAGTWGLKITTGSWDPCYPAGDNHYVTVESACDLTVTFNPSNSKIVVTGSGVKSVILVAGDMGLCGGTKAWDASGNINLMTVNADGTYTWNATDVAAGYYEFKVVDNNAWIGDPNANNDNGNWHIEPAETSDITIVYNPLTGAVTTTVTPASADDDSDTDSDPEPTGMIIVHAQVPEDWTAANAYVWDANNVWDAAWPGTAMEKGDDGWYTLAVPSNSAYIIINDGKAEGALQTQDIELTGADEIWIIVEANEDGSFTGTLTETNPKTADSMNLFAVCAAMLLTGAAVVTAVAGKKRFF